MQMQMLREKGSNGDVGPLSGSRCVMWLAAFVALGLYLLTYYKVVWGELQFTEVEGLHKAFNGALVAFVAPYVGNKLSKLGS